MNTADPSRPLRIAFVAGDYPTESNFGSGVGTCFHSTARSLCQAGHAVEVFVPSDTTETIPHNEVTVQRVAFDKQRVEWYERLARWRLNHTIDCAFLSHSLRSAVLRRHREAPFDLVQGSSGGAANFWWCVRGGLPVTTFVAYHPAACRDSNKQKPTLDRRWLDWMEMLVVRKAHGRFAPSKWAVDRFREQYNIELEWLSPPFLLEEIAPDESVLRERVGGDPYLLFVGRLVPLKGVDLLAEAMGALLPKYPDLRLVLVGSDHGDDAGRSMWSYFEERCGAHLSRVLHLDALRHAQLYPLYANAAGVVIPSRVENMPNVLQEAMIHGRPVIGPTGVSFEELVVDGEQGVLFENGNATALTQAMEALWTMPQDVRVAMGARAREAMRRMSPAGTVPAYVAHYRRVIAAAKGIAT